MPQLQPHQPVSVEVPGLERLDAAVAGLEPGRMVLALLRAPAMPTRFFNRRPAIVEGATARGVYRQEGMLEAVASARAGRVREDLLRFAFAEPEELSQRREDVRADVIVPVTVAAEELDGMPFRGRTLNLSGSGLLLSGADALPRAPELWLALELPNAETVVEARGRVVRATREGHRGVQIERIRPADRERMIRYVFERQRQGLRMTRDG